VPEYVLVSEDLYLSDGTSSLEHSMQEIAQDLEGIGPVRTYFVGVDEIAGPLAPLPDPSLPRRIGGTLGMVGRGLPHILRRRGPRDTASAN